MQSSYTEEHRTLTLVNDDQLISMAKTIQSNGKDSITMVRDTVKSNGDAPSPWWQRKNVRIQEIENENERTVESGGAQSSEQSVRRSWVPPQPPPLAMAEAAEAIRRPKPSSVPKEQGSDDQSVAPSSNASEASDDMQRNPQISEPEGATTESGSVKNGEIEMHDEEAKHEEQ